MSKNRTLCTFLPKMSKYRRDFDKTKCMSFLIKDEKLSEKYNEIGKKVSNIIKKKLVVNLYTMKNKIQNKIF